MIGRAARFFREFYYQTRKSSSRRRRVVAKAEHLEKQSAGTIDMFDSLKATEQADAFGQEVLRSEHP